MSRPTTVRLSIFLATVVATWAVLSLGSTNDESGLRVGQLAPVDFVAEVDADVVDEVQTEANREAAREAVDISEARQTQPVIERSVEESISAVFDDAKALAVADPPTTPPTTLPELPPTTTSTSPSSESTTTTAPPQPVPVTGVVFLDVDGDGAFRPDAEGDRVDRGLERVSVEVTADGESTTTVQTGPGGVWRYETSVASIRIRVDDSDSQIPDGWIIDPDDVSQVVTCTQEPCQADPIGLVVNTRSVEEIEAALAASYPLPGDTITYLAVTAVDDVVRAALGEPVHLDVVRAAALGRVFEEFGRRITEADLQEVQAQQRTRPPLVFHPDTGRDEVGGEAAGEIVATFLQANYLVNTDLLTQKQNEAAAAVEDVSVPFVAGQTIVTKGSRLTALHISAIEETAQPSVEQASIGLLAVLATAVALLGLYLMRFRSDLWARPRMVALVGIIILLAAAAVRGTVILEEASSAYVLPAVAFGFMTAILFDQRLAVLMTVFVGVITALGTLSAETTVYAVMAALVPIPFVSSVSTRGAFRNAVVLSALAAALIAGANSWFFYTGPPTGLLDTVGPAIVWAFAVSAVAALLVPPGLQFFESAFDITTTLTLLDLTDRNHEALQLLQEEAFGTFNHSLMVGTLADAAARAIGANSLLVRAMAYYHDLGKTQNPTYFIENQFGMSNPHDLLDPKESAEIIRSHVSAGVALAREHKIPTDIVTGIVSHHGDGVMRFFYEKAREMHGDDVDIDDYRHAGHKPRSAETAILMLADALEAACRAVFQTEEPVPDAIEKVVDRIVNEKLEDGQLSQSPLTLGEITKIRRAFFDSLVGHYHQRIAYPNFPGS
ncbi:MAG: HDIG domain-containing protein [Acidimicrobiia bacterium]|nr:HDIG domain-containing protein [Acidimicrobiia bacterium]